MSNLNPDFSLSVQKAKNHQDELRTIYKSIISLVNDLRSRSKIHMNQISDLEDGLSLGMKDQPADELNKKNNIEQLSEDINQFNSNITTTIKRFEDEFDLILDSYEQAILAFTAKEGELSSLLRLRKEMIYLEYLLRKFKSKITALQQMNNVLFSFSNELRQVKDRYKNNLSNVSSSITIACEKSYKVIEKIQSIS